MGADSALAREVGRGGASHRGEVDVGFTGHGDVIGIYVRYRVPYLARGIAPQGRDRRREDVIGEERDVIGEERT